MYGDADEGGDKYGDCWIVEQRAGRVERAGKHHNQLRLEQRHVHGDRRHGRQHSGCDRDGKLERAEQNCVGDCERAGFREWSKLHASYCECARFLFLYGYSEWNGASRRVDGVAVQRQCKCERAWQRDGTGRGCDGRIHGDSCVCDCGSDSGPDGGR